MKAQLTAMAASIRGKVAGSTFRNVGGQTIISTTSPSLKGRIGKPIDFDATYSWVFKSHYRQAFGYANSMWRQLTSEQRKIWKGTQLNGSTGRAAFLSSIISQLIADIRVAPSILPSSAEPRVLNPYTFVKDQSGSIFLYWNYPGSGFQTFTLVYATRPFSPSVNSAQKRWRFISTRNAINERVNLTQAWEIAYGSMPSNQKIFIKVIAVALASGRRSEPVYLSFIPSELPIS